MSACKKRLLGILAILAVALLGYMAYFRILMQNTHQVPLQALTEAEARVIAEASCIKGGEALGPGTLDTRRNAWLFDANLNAVREGCTPVCAVSSEMRSAALEWRCADAGALGGEPTPVPTPEPAPVPSPEPEPVTTPEPSPPPVGGVACTMEAKLCPDGSAVGRVPPTCEFAPCPDAGPLGTLSGTILLGPTCPVVRVGDTSCDDKPYQAMVRVVRAGSTSSTVVAQAMSAEDGTFAFSVPYGTYTVSVETPGILPRCDEAEATVSSVGGASVRISCDSGIR